MTVNLWLLRHRLLVVLLALALALAGLVAWRNLPIDAFPDVTNTQVMILSQAPGLAATDVEDRISYPIEQVMRGLPRVTQVRSLSKAGLSQVVVVFEDGVDTYWTRQQVFERLAAAREQLPPGVEPELGPISTGLGEIYQYTLESDSLDAMELRTIQDWLVAPLLKPVPGVNEVNSFGGHVRQVQVLVSPEKLLARGLTLDEVAQALEENNANAGGGVVARGWSGWWRGRASRWACPAPCCWPRWHWCRSSAPSSCRPWTRAPSPSTWCGCPTPRWRAPWPWPRPWRSGWPPTPRCSAW